MTRLIKSLKVRSVLLAVLVGSCVLMTWGTRQTNAEEAGCMHCVFPTGGICVACERWLNSGYNVCVAYQETCQCGYSGGECTFTLD